MTENEEQKGKKKVVKKAAEPLDALAAGSYTLRYQLKLVRFLNY